MPGPYSFLKSLSKAWRASSELRGAGGPTSIGTAAGTLLVPSRATVTRGINELHSLTLSFMAMRTGMGLRHWKRMDGSKLEHCLQQCSSALHLGQLPRKPRSAGGVVARLYTRPGAPAWRGAGGG